MSISQEQRNEIRRRLPWGSMALIAKACGLSRMAVSNWFRGGNSGRIEAAVMKALEIEVKRQNEIQSKLEKLLG
ncbi:MAG: hypothetical protein HDR92_03525 [Bacteroides sp.]|nr:hypothetical protein [Bacteroides sp.]